MMRCTIGLKDAGAYNVRRRVRVVGYAGLEYLYGIILRGLMRVLFAVLALLGVTGIVLGILTIVRGMSGPGGESFSFENYGGPGPIIAGLIVLAASLYLRSIWRPDD
jgi:hypothetical protein